MGFPTIGDYCDTPGNWLTSFTIPMAITTVVGSAYDMSMNAGGYPRQNVYPGGLLTSTQLYYRNTGNIWHGSNVSPATKHLSCVHIQAHTTGSTPISMTLCDYIMFYPLIDGDNNAYQAMTNSITLPRYTNGMGLRAFLVVTSVLGGTPATFSMTYTEPGGTTSISPPVSLIPNTAAGQLPAVQATNTGLQSGMFLPLDEVDDGVLNIQGVQLSNGTGGGWMCVVIAAPIMTISLETVIAGGPPVINNPMERYLLTEQAKLPQIYDQAFLNFLMLAGVGVATPTYSGRIETVWN